MRNSDLPLTGDIYSRLRLNVAELKTLHPSLFCDAMLTCSWPDGWHELVRSVCGFAANHYPYIRWHHIQEKYASLRMEYVGNSTRLDSPASNHPMSNNGSGQESLSVPGLQEVIDNAETRSLETCSLCSAAGASPVCFIGWWLTSCDRCVPLIAADRVPLGDRWVV